jgi:hypothetical protein
VVPTSHRHSRVVVAAVAHLVTILQLQLHLLNHVVSLVVVAVVSRVPLHSCTVHVIVNKVIIVSYFIIILTL